jgi:isoprenylcysteine carboxyl methyltransferase (ICMT) family protein YpbQ
VLTSSISDVEELAMIFYAAAALFLANFALGVLVQFGVVDTKPFRWLHHALFFAVFVSAAIAVAAGLWEGAWYGWALMPVLALFLVLPRVRAGTVWHAALASAALIFYVLGFLSLVWEV